MAGNEIDVTMGAALKKKTRLRITSDEIQWGDTVVQIDRVEHVAGYWATLSMNMVRVSRTFQCWLADDRSEVSIDLGAGRVKSQEERLAEASAALEEAVFQRIVPRLVDSAAAQVRGGATVTVGGRIVIKPPMPGGVPGMVRKWSRTRSGSTVALGPSGIELGGEKGVKSRWVWPSITGCSLKEGEVVLAADGKNVKLLPMTYSDAILLPNLVQALQMSG